MSKWHKFDLFHNDLPFGFAPIRDHYPFFIFPTEFHFIQVEDHKYVWAEQRFDDIYFHHAPVFSYDEWDEIEYWRLPDKAKRAIVKEKM